MSTLLAARTEPFSHARAEIAPWLDAQWRELDYDHDLLPLKMHWEIYTFAERGGQLLCVTLRDGDVLAGWVWCFVNADLHHRSKLTASVDLFYVRPKYRGRLGGLRLIRALERELRTRGVVRLQVGCSLRGEAGRLFKALGYQPIQTTWAKVLPPQAGVAS